MDLCIFKNYLAIMSVLIALLCYSCSSKNEYVDIDGVTTFILKPSGYQYIEVTLYMDGTTHSEGVYVSGTPFSCNGTWATSEGSYHDKIYRVLFIHDVAPHESCHISPDGYVLPGIAAPDHYDNPEKWGLTKAVKK